MTNRALSFEQTVPRALIHRVTLGEVYIADSLEIADGQFRLAVQIPGAHSVWFDRRAPFHDPLSTAEAARQGVYVVVHRHLRVPDDMAFILKGLEFRVIDLESYRDRGTGPLEGVLTLRLVDRSSAGMTFRGDLEIAGTMAVALAGDLLLLPRHDYSAVREYQRRHRPTPAPPAAGPPLMPAAVGRRDVRNCVLAESTGGSSHFPVIVDQAHPSFFEHGYDHVPGPLIVEAYRQAALVTAHRRGALPTPVAAVTGCDAIFTQFAELDALVECFADVEHVRPDASVVVAVQLVQFDTVISTSRVELRPFPCQS